MQLSSIQGQGVVWDMDLLDYLRRVVTAGGREWDDYWV